MHAIWTLPDGDTDYALRWRAIKSIFSRSLPAVESTTASRTARGERGIWQRRFWEHVIRDDEDYARHVDYIHYNPVKHGHCRHAIDWPHSSFKRWVQRGIYPDNWGAGDAIRQLQLD